MRLARAATHLPAPMPALALQITRFVDAHQPGFVECRLLDAHGRSHLIVEKLPIVSTENLRRDSPYPREGRVACQVESEWIDESGRHLVQVSTAQPWDVESTEGIQQFTLLSSQVDR